MISWTFRDVKTIDSPDCNGHIHSYLDRFLFESRKTFSPKSKLQRENKDPCREENAPNSDPPTYRLACMFNVYHFFMSYVFMSNVLRHNVVRSATWKMAVRWPWRLIINHQRVLVDWLLNWMFYFVGRNSRLIDRRTNERLSASSAA